MATKVQCPAPGECGFEGEPKSVHAHITASNDHKGESGVSYQREIADLLPNGEQAPWERGGVETLEKQEETSEEVLAGKGEQGNEAGNEQGNASDESEDEGGNGESEQSGGEAPSEDHDTPDVDPPEDGEMPGIPLPMDRTTFWLILGLAAVLVLLYVYWENDEEDDEDDQDDEDVADEIEEAGAGLIG